VVQLHERLAVAGRAPDVRQNQGDAELVQVVVAAAEEPGAGLPLRPPVDADDDRPPAAEACRGLVEEAGDGAAVEARPVDQLRLGEVAGVEPGGLALGPPHQPPGDESQGVGVLARPPGREREAELGRGAAPAIVPPQSGREPRDAPLRAGTRVEYVPRAGAVLVR